MKARERNQRNTHRKWVAVAGLATAIAVAGMGEVGAQQAAGVSTFPDIRAPQSLGFNPGVISPFSPSIQRPFSGTFAPIGVPGPGGVSMFGFTPMAPVFADIRAPQSLGFNPGIVSPFTPDIRLPLTGTFNPAVNVPITGTFNPAVNAPITSPVVVGDTVTGFTGGAPFFVGPSGYYWLPNGGEAVTPVAVPVPVPVPVTAAQQRALAARMAQRPRLRLTPTPERRSLQAAEQVMARTPLTEGTVVSADSHSVRVRVGSRVRSYRPSQVFFFTAGGEMRSAAVQMAGLTRGRRVLVPEPPTA